MTTEQHKCCTQVYDRSMRFPRPHPCKRKATIERDGKHYCAIHDPVSMAEKQAARTKKWKEDFDRRQKEHRKMERLQSLRAIVEAGASDSEIAKEVREIFQ